MNFQSMHRQRKFILIAAALGIISVFLPWVTISIFGVTQSINGFRGSGILAFVIFFIAGIIACVGNQAQPLEKNLWFLVMLCGAVVLAAIVIKLTSSSGSLDGGLGFADANIGIGVWFAIAASAGIVLFAWLFRNPADSLKSGFEGLKKSISIPATPFTTGTNGNAETRTQNKIAELEKLVRLKENGGINDEEFQQLKSKLM